jgi:hypothetical protein
VPQVDRHPVAAHGVLDFPHDGRAGRLDSQGVLHLDDVVTAGFQAVHSVNPHNRSQVSALDQQVVGAHPVLGDVIDDGAVDGRDTLWKGGEVLFESVALWNVGKTNAGPCSMALYVCYKMSICCFECLHIGLKRSPVLSPIICIKLSN